MPSPSPVRLALWSGPRNISTAMMRSFESRSDSYVTDEPLYSHYLKVTGLPHPGRDEVIAHHESDWRKVVAWLGGPVPEGKSLWYQKHMAHHLLPEIDRGDLRGEGWLSQLENCFLIREPREMLASLAKVTPFPSIEDTGLPQQVELFDQIRARRGTPPPVIDARDVLVDPRRTLSALCARVEIDFEESMLAWAPGRRATDGIWAEHWYAEVERSTGFATYRPKGDDLPERLEPLAAQCSRLYDRLAEHRL
ncbi:MAG TPA: HAD family hydrolase [Thermoanaerobaculia bacterium]|nr:HAD family hydrolase [Thermoanaerobaculia bacterium]